MIVRVCLLLGSSDESQKGGGGMIVRVCLLLDSSDESQKGGGGIIVREYLLLGIAGPIGGLPW